MIGERKIKVLVCKPGLDKNLDFLGLTGMIEGQKFLQGLLEMLEWK
jgi:hypothetical protein